MNLEEHIIAIVSKNIEKKQEIDLSKNLINDLGVDSLDILMIINALEDEFRITIDEEDFKDIKTVGDIVTSLRRRYPKIED